MASSIRRKSTPTAPRYDRGTSLRLDQTGQRIERIRRSLLVVGFCGLSFTGGVGLVAALVNGEREHTEDGTAIWTMAGWAIGATVLILVGLLLGRLTADWWHPRMRETVPTGSLPEGLSAKSPERRSASPADSEYGTKRRYRRAKQVRGQIRDAQIFERRLDGSGTLLTEPILVLHRRRRGEHEIFDQEGNPLGRAVRVQNLISGKSAWTSEVCDSEGQPALAIHLAARRRWLKGVPSKTGTYAVCSPNGTEIASIGKLTKSSSRAVTAGADPVARLDEGHSMTVSDADGRQIAHIHNTSPEAGWYVVDCKAPVDEPLRSLVLAASIVWDDTRT